MPRLRPVRRDPPLVTVRSLPGVHLTTDALLTMFPGVTLQPLYNAAQSRLIDALVVRARHLTPGYQPARFSSMHRVKLPPRSQWATGAPRRNIAAALRRLMLRLLPVDRVSVETVICPPPVSDGTDDDAKDLLHLDPAPVGLGVEAVWTESGGRGQGEVLADVEGGWKTEHEEFTGILFDLLPDGVMEDDLVPHGTEVLSTAVGRENGNYGLGVAPDVPTVILSAEKRSSTGDIDTEAALLDALGALADRALGGVLLLEVQKNAHDFDTSVKDKVQGPCEMVPELYEQIQLAVANHIVVVEAAGNGGTDDGSIGEGLNLDDHPSLLHGDSGAILVGQSQWSESGGHEVIADACTGARIDCFSWGFKVYAATAKAYGKIEGTDLTYFKDGDTGGFDGTSAASAIIAGAALVVQSLVRHGAAGALGYLTPMQMRSLLRSRTAGVNTPLESGATEIIGVQPDLQHIGSELGILPDLYIRDNVGDDGGPHAGMLSRSPDIILRTSALTGGAPDEAFGEGSGTEDDGDLSEDPIVGETSAELYVRVRNRGGKDVAGAEVKTYYATSATLVEPTAWTPIGSTLVDVPQGDTIAVAGPIPWTSVPGEGHYCLIATVEHASDPLFAPAVFKNLDGFKSHVRLENNVAWRNFNVVAVPDSGLSTLMTSISGAAHGDPLNEEPMELRVEARLPGGASLEIELPRALLPRMSLPDGAFRADRRTRVGTAGVTNLGIARLKTRETHAVTLHVQLPKNPRRTSARYEVALIQLHKGQPVGRVTWQLVSTGRGRS